MRTLVVFNTKVKDYEHATEIRPFLDMIRGTLTSSVIRSSARLMLSPLSFKKLLVKTLRKGSQNCSPKKNLIHVNGKAADGSCSISRLFGFVVTNSEGVAFRVQKPVSTRRLPS